MNKPGLKIRTGKYSVGAARVPQPPLLKGG